MASSTAGNLQNPYLRPQEAAVQSAALDLNKKIVTGVKVGKRALSKAALGPQCWKCFSWFTWWTCKGCGRSYHMRCAAQNDEGSLNDIEFEHMSVEKAMEAKYGKSTLLNCMMCVEAQKQLMVIDGQIIPEQELGKIFAHIASLMEESFQLVMGIISGDSRMTTSIKLIKESALNIGRYKTIDAFSAEFQLLLFQTVRSYGETSEEAETVKIILDFLHKELAAVRVCWQCYLRRYKDINATNNLYGKLQNATTTYKLMEIPCNVPHPIVWVKVKKFLGYWPAKLLSFQEETKMACVHCFKEKAVRYIKVEDRNRGVLMYNYSKNYVNKRQCIRQEIQRKPAVKACDNYIQSMRRSFDKQIDVRVEKNAAKFRSYTDAFNSMFTKELQK